MTMPTTLFWILPAVAALLAGWFAAAWFYKRKIDLLQSQHKAARQTSAEHAQQVRRQIAQLQAELAARPPARPVAAPAERDPRGSAATAAAEARRAAAEKLVPDHGFAHTAVSARGFATTEVMEEAAAVSAR